MRIQHNIMAMSAYRNYTNNVSAMKKNLEKLSSGYKINRAGDDAAGLAISEKMRAQITGLETAQKNAKDGISLVQTAEGALTEVHDMLNRMVELATQSANGTYDNTTDRAQLQKELDQLKSEIDRIADSSNFNGIKLLDGSMDAESAQAQYSTLDTAGIKSIMLPEPTGAGSAGDIRSKTILETNSFETKNPSFEVSFDGVKHGITKDADKTIKVKVGDLEILLDEADMGKNAGDELSGTELAQAFLDSGTAATAANFQNGVATIGGHKYDVTVNGDALKFTMQDADVAALDKTKEHTFHYDVTLTGEATSTSTTSNTYTTTAFTQGSGTGTTTTATINVTTADGETLTFTKGTLAVNAAATFLAGTNGLATATATNAAGDTVTFGDLFNVSFANNAFTFEAKTAGEEGAKVTGISFADTGTGTTAASFAAGDATVVDGKTSTSGTTGYLNGGGEVNVTYSPTQPDQLASTTLNLTGKLEDGARLTLGDTTYIIAKGDDSAFANVSGDNIVVVKTNANDSEELVASKLTEAIKQGNKTFTVSHQAGTAQIGIKQKQAVKGTTDMTTMDKFASYIGLSTVVTKDAEGNDIAKPVAGKALTLQIGDTAESFNQLTVNIKDMHAMSLGLDEVSIATQEDAAKAVDKIKAAINYVSDVRGTLGATQNRLDHTINNLSVMTENIQDAESTIRDVDVAEEMMAYTKNNILIQSAQAMLAQANQVPQGVLQLLQ